MPDWATIGAIAAVVAVIIAWLQLKRTPQPSTSPTESLSKNVEFFLHRIVAPIPDEVIKKAGLGDSKVTADEILVRNISGRDLTNVRLRASRRKNIWHAGIAWAKVLSEKAFKINVEDDSVLIIIDDLPAGEIFSIHIVSVDWSIMDVQLRSENSSVALKEADAPFARYS